jgi:hypothetical protein
MLRTALLCVTFAYGVVPSRTTLQLSGDARSMRRQLIDSAHFLSTCCALLGSV